MVKRPGWTSSAKRQYSQRRFARLRTWTRSRLVMHPSSGLGLVQGLTGLRVENRQQVPRLDVVREFFPFFGGEKPFLILLGKFLHAVLVGLAERDVEDGTGEFLRQVAMRGSKRRPKMAASLVAL
jgi:hypothetical protein